MYARILAQMREKVLTGDYVMTLHADDEMSADGFTIFDVENGIVTGSIVERQTDKATHEWKYVIEGRSLAGDFIGIVTKLSPTRKLVIITVYGEES